jgi:hypothetical protein
MNADSTPRGGTPPHLTHEREEALFTISFDLWQIGPDDTDLIRRDSFRISGKKGNSRDPQGRGVALSWFHLGLGCQSVDELLLSQDNGSRSLFLRLLGPIVAALRPIWKIVFLRMWRDVSELKAELKL